MGKEVKEDVKIQACNSSDCQHDCTTKTDGKCDAFITGAL